MRFSGIDTLTELETTMDAVMTVWPSELCIVLRPGQTGEERRTYHTSGDSEDAQQAMIGRAVLNAMHDGVTSIAMRMENFED